MKKITRLSIFTVALMTLASSCNRDEAGLNPPEQKYGTVTITADAARTKTVLDGGAVKWEDGDEIALRFTHDTKETVVGKFATSIEAGSAASADFTGTVALDVLREDGGYDDAVHAVYPYDALTGEGVVFALPASQQARDNGAFAEGLNLASAALSLDDIRDDGKASGTFLNALSILRFSVTGNDVTSVTLTGTAPLAGTAPVVFSDGGRLVIDAVADWADTEKEMSVTLTPADGSDCFAEGTVYNLLVWPGTHSSLTATLNFKEYGAFDKTSAAEFTFEPSKYYTLDFNANSETLVKEITDPLDEMDLELPGLEDRLAALETTAEKISMLLNQIQSVALMTEYLDNAVYAPYAQLTYSKLKMDIKLDFIVRPAKAARLLLDICAEEGNLSDVLCARIDYKDGGLGTLTINDAVLDGDILTVVVDAEGISNGLYEGNAIASVALQISDGNTEILSDFARLVPKKGAMMNITTTDGIPVLKGAGLSMGFSFGASDMSNSSIVVENAVGFASTPTVSYNSSGTGFFNASFAEDADLSQMSVDLVLTCGEESDRQTLTFAEGGRFEVETSGVVDYIGGEVSVNVVSSDYPSVTSELRNAGDWIYQTYSGSNNTLTVNVNEGLARSAEVVFTIKSTGNITYTKSVSVSQKAYGSAIDENRYHQTKGSLELQAATAGYTPLNIVIVGDGYQKKDLLKGGKFERSARSAMEAFFGVEPYRSFRDRFRVMMVAYESVDEGLSLQNGAQKDTYFKSYYQGSGNTYVNLSGGDYTSVSNVVRNDLGWSDDATYYRTIVIMLINTSEGIGSNAAVYRAAYSNTSTLGEPYASFALAMVTANNTETSNLIRHEAGGHAFGRLGDEYPSKTWNSDVNGMHDIGWYRNITVDKSLWNWDEFIGRSGYGDVTYYQPNDSYWCPIDHTKYNSIMYNNTNKFNAPCRRIIYERIIKQTEGNNAYSWEKFLEYDKKNL